MKKKIRRKKKRRTREDFFLGKNLGKSDKNVRKKIGKSDLKKKIRKKREERERRFFSRKIGLEEKNPKKKRRTREEIFFYNVSRSKSRECGVPKERKRNTSVTMIRLKRGIRPYVSLYVLSPSFHCRIFPFFWTEREIFFPLFCYPIFLD